MKLCRERGKEGTMAPKKKTSGKTGKRKKKGNSFSSFARFSLDFQRKKEEGGSTEARGEKVSRVSLAVLERGGLPSAFAPAGATVVHTLEEEEGRKIVQFRVS